ncbi:Probable RND efflux membrane fusion protein [hydrothermal vent metagenome]|uniref:Probable RND efflux membrane fusion protein n=1 Tax=hydrothermal vent metagenome TaxID=652676 RepID=A0A1W1BBY1_9ZZZZ
MPFKHIYSNTIFLVSILLFSACELNQKVEEKKVIIKEPDPISVNVHTLKKETYPIWIDFSGKTQSVDEVMVTSRVSGELEKILFKAGSNVKKNQTLFSLDKSKYQSIWEERNAILEKDKASLNLANSNVKRYKPLVKEQLAPREKLDELIATKKQLEATIKADKASLSKAQLDLDYCDIKATISGKIGKELYLLGNIINIGDTLAKIVQTRFLYVNFHPSSNEVSLIKKYKSEENPKVKVLLNNGDITINGQIDFIDNVSNTSTGTVAMRARIDNKDDILLAGTFVRLKLFITDKIPVIAVEPNQISQNQQGEYVLIVNNKNEIESREIKVTYANNDLSIISKGLKEGDRVVVGTVAGLSDGTKVSVTEVKNPILKLDK